MMFFCTSVVPAATVTGMLSSHWRCISPSRRHERVVVEQQAPGPEQLEPDLPGELLHLRVVDAGDRRLDGGHLARGLDGDRAVVQELGRLDAHRQRGEPRAHGGILGERAAVDHGVARVRDEVLEHPVGARVAGDADALEREPLPHQRPPVVLVAEAVGDRDHGVVEEDLAELALARHARDRPHGDAGRAHVDEEHRDALLLLHLGLVRASSRQWSAGASA